ncbi:hypothetical protein Poli38472_000902 [Pythium oligandrum]|uniref:Phospholipase n=1 Tax=Pythium oligandrum TaxID=41045 RepID=A0A8K1CDM3_PYTOL|nr:hypothetical protein Poli38472_000902 [Pythium oligandrum]|eukprot:TMW60860.1 hypothetical protein Poli38472_000902 [Pythium oligandrum]
MTELSVQTSTDFASMEEIPTKAFFPGDYILRYKGQVRELIQRMEHLMEEVENFEMEGEKSIEWHGLKLSTLSRDTVWHNLTALQDCGAAVEETIELFKQKIRESVGMVATNPAHFNMDLPVSPISATSEYSSDSVESDDMDLPEGFQDVEPVTSKKVARALNDEVIHRVKVVFGDNEQEFENFKNHALLFGTGKESAYAFYNYLTRLMTDEEITSIIPDFARLLPQATLRIPLLREHHIHISGKKYHLDERNKSWSNIHRARDESLDIPASEIESCDSEDDNIDELPETLRLSTINHLMFIIHGIGQHIDFQEGEFRSWDGQSGLEGGNHAFRDLYRTMLDTMFRDIPVALETQSIEWHEDLHEPTGVDNVFDLISPEGAAGIRDFTKETLMDVLYYLSPRYGQLIIDTVTQQLNQKYRVFMEEHPKWNGKVSIFAHSLGSVISYDILTHKAGEKARNGVRFPGLDFQVENFFAVGSPVPIMVLARGDLKLEDGHFNGGIKKPMCNRYFNIFHPIDPIAYRIEPLIKPDMHDRQPVQLISAHSVRNVGFAKIQEMLASITGPIHGFAYRMDYVMKRRKREQGMMELAYATASHSSYWMSEDVVLFTLMQICKPVVEKLHRYTSAMRPLPTLMRNIVELTPHTKVVLSSNVQIRDRCTGFYYERIAFMSKDRLYIIPRLQEATCKRKWFIPLSAQSKATYGDDSFTLKIMLNSPGSATPSAIYVLKAPSTPVRDEWLNSINQAIIKISGGQSNGHTARRPRRAARHLIELHADQCIDYFSAIRTGFLQEKSPKGWYENWNNRWLVLQDDKVSCFENSPRLDFIGQFKLRQTTVLSYEASYLIRIVSRTGTAVEMRVRDQAAFDTWLDTLAKVKGTQVIRHKDLIENSPSAVLLVHDKDGGGQGAWLQTKIESYDLLVDDKGNQYANFAIQVNSSTLGNSIVYRRYSEFGKLHRQLRKMFPHEQIPAFPSTRMWNKFDPAYLKQKTVLLRGYLREICKRCANTRGQELLMEFLELSPPNLMVNSAEYGGGME